MATKRRAGAKFPTRSRAHVDESASVRAITNCFPDHWVIRHVTERDYGVDLVVEMARGEEQRFSLIGDMFAVQAKSLQEAAWHINPSGARFFAVGGIKAGTASYWLSLPMPVFLCVHERATDQVYFLDVKQFIRRNYHRVLRQRTVTFCVDEGMCLTKEDGLPLLLILYNIESSFEAFAQSLLLLLAHEKTFLHHAERHRTAPPHEEVDDEDVAIFVTFLNACRLVSRHLGVGWPGPSISDVVSQEGARFAEQQMQHQTLSWGYSQVSHPYRMLLERGRHLVANEERVFWLYRDPFLVRACYDEATRDDLKRRRQELRDAGR